MEKQYTRDEMEIKQICDDITSSIIFYTNRASWGRKSPKPHHPYKGQVKNVSTTVDSQVDDKSKCKECVPLKDPSDDSSNTAQEQKDSCEPANQKENSNAAGPNSNRSKIRKQRKRKPKYPDAADIMFRRDINSLLIWVCEKNFEAIKVMQEHRRIWNVTRSLEMMIPNCRSWPTGSRMNGLSSYFSDLDIFLDTDNLYYGQHHQDAFSQANLVLEVEKIMFKSKLWRQIEPVPYARTPIIRAYHVPTNLYCDISFRNGLGIENSQWIAYMLRILPVTRPMILVLKEWSNLTTLNRQFNSYSLSLMIIFYLQIKNYLPSLSNLRSHYRGLPKIISNWECQYSTSKAACEGLQTPLTLLHLLHGFFLYYHEFDYATQVICPLMGHTINKHQFLDDGATLPVEMVRYTTMVTQVSQEIRDANRVSRYVVIDPKEDIFRSEAPMCIQDPFDLSHNLAKAIKPSTVEKLKTICNIEAVKCERLLAMDLSAWYNRIWN